MAPMSAPVLALAGGLQLVPVELQAVQMQIQARIPTPTRMAAASSLTTPMLAVQQQGWPEARLSAAVTAVALAGLIPAAALVPAAAEVWSRTNGACRSRGGRCGQRQLTTRLRLGKRSSDGRTPRLPPLPGLPPLQQRLHQRLQCELHLQHAVLPARRLWAAVQPSPPPQLPKQLRQSWALAVLDRMLLVVHLLSRLPPCPVGCVLPLLQ